MYPDVRGARDDRPSPLAHEDRGTHRLAPGVLEDDVGILADERPDVLAEATPFALVLGVLVETRTGIPPPGGR